VTVKDDIDGKQSNLHDAALQQAISDRFVLKTTPRTVEGPPIRYPEQLNAGSPINVVAGEGTTDLSTLIKHYEDTQRKQADAADAARQRR